MSEVDAIKDALSITEVVGRYLELKKAGINYVGLCPFHHEKTPSFYVSPERKTYKCFGCGEGGDVYSFVEQVEGMGFREVLEKFSQETGIVLDTSQIKQTKHKNDKAKLYAILEHAKIFWQKELGTNPQAIEYLKKRGFSKRQVIDYSVGYAPALWDGLKTYLISKGIQEHDMETAGLIKRGEKGSTYDRFRDRIIFPLRDARGRTVAFSGRYIGNDDVSAKYLNSPETPVFSKSRELYGLDFAKQAIRKNNFAIVVEGQVDLLMAQSVYLNTVATSGTALTPQHVESIKRFTDRLIFVFDPDEAGVNAAHKASKMALSHDFEVRIAKLPTGEDPADVISRSLEEYKQIIKQADDVFDYWVHFIHAGGLGARKQTKIVEERIIPLLSEHGNVIEQDRYLKHLAHKLDISEQALRSRVQFYKTQKGAYVASTKSPILKEAQRETEENPLRHLALLEAWQGSLGVERIVDEKFISGKLPENEQAEFATLSNSIAKDTQEQIFFEFEKIYENSIMLENDIIELFEHLSTYRRKQNQGQLAREHKQALQRGDTERAKILLQTLQQSLE